MRLRREVRSFAEAMERRLQEHDGARGDEWLRETSRWHQGRLREELAEFRDAMRFGDWPEVRDEAADVANFLMFIVEVRGRKPAP